MSELLVKPMTIQSFRQQKEAGKKLVVVTAYDALFGRLVDEAGVDAVLVGDSLANVVAGLDTTVPVTLDQMIYHGKMARRGVKRALLWVDMPFLTYQASTEQAIMNCGRVLQETSASAVKMEGASEEMAETIRRVVNAGIPVVGHIGFTPQSVHTLGTRVQGKGADGAARLLDEARRLEDAGVFALVLELIPAELSEKITAALTIPTIGIGAGPGCDGQVLVLPDLLGLNDKFSPKFLKRYGDMAGDVKRAVGGFASDVRDGKYPGPEHSF